MNIPAFVFITVSALAMLGSLLALFAQANQPKETIVMILPDFDAPLADINAKLDTLISAASSPTGASPQDVADTLAAVTALQSKVDAAVAALPQPVQV